MKSLSPEMRTIEILGALSEVPFVCSSEEDALRKITELGRAALGSHTCSLAFIDLEESLLTHVACTSTVKEFEQFMMGRPLKIGSHKKGSHLEIEVGGRGLPIEKYGLKEKGQGVADPEVARRYGFDSLLSYPLRSEGTLVGYINHFSDNEGPFGPDVRWLLEILANEALLTIERFRQFQILNKSLGILSDLSAKLLSMPVADFLQFVSEKACELLSAPICVVWRLDSTGKGFRVAAAAGDVDRKYRKLTLHVDDPRLQRRISTTRVSYIRNAWSNSEVVHAAQVKKRGWISLLTAPLWIDDRVVGLLDVFTKKNRDYKVWERESFEAFANHAALAFQRVGLLREAEGRRKLQGLTETILEMTKATTVKELLRIFLDGGLLLVGSTQGWISQLDYSTGFLNIAADSGNLPKELQLKVGSGITGLALREGKPLRVRDVKGRKWQQQFVTCWPETRSELAIPILVDNARVRLGKEVSSGSKPIGVLNIESPSINAFSRIDEECLWSLSRYAAVMIERLEYDRKQNELSALETGMMTASDDDAALAMLMRGMTDTLLFEYCNISLVMAEQNSVRSEFVLGIQESEMEAFKNLEVHPLDGADIEAEIVRSREIEAPPLDDPRLNRQLDIDFQLNRLARVFVPMIELSTNRVIGVAEAGYNREYRNYIYERDVEMLKRLVDYAGQALQRRRSLLLDQLSHELRSPIVGIRSNASFLQDRLSELPTDIVQKKFDDILADCEILLYQVAELEFFLGRPPKASKFERTLVFRDVVKKTINQLKTVAAARKLDTTRIHYQADDARRVIVTTDKVKLNQVVYNLLINAIKYARPDPRAFTIRIELEENNEFYVLKFKDWGVGIKREYQDRIFEKGYRTPEAEAIDVSGSGIGLFLSRTLMEQIGGELILVGLHRPTEFHVRLPKRLKEDGDDPVRRRRP